MSKQSSAAHSCATCMKLFCMRQFYLFVFSSVFMFLFLFLHVIVLIVLYFLHTVKIPSRVRAMASFDTLCSNILLTATAMYSSHRLFKNHRAPSLGFFLLGLSAGFSTVASFTTYFNSLPKEDMSWAAEVLSLTLLSFEYLWLSEDHNTAYILICGSCFLVALHDWLSPDAYTVMTHCLCLSTLSCSLTVCLFTENLLGAIGGLTLTLHLAMFSTTAANGLTEWILRVFSSVGCWASTQALEIFLIEVTDRSNISI